MNIYYAAPIKGGNDKENNARVIDVLKRHGTVLSEHIFFMDERNNLQTFTNEQIYAQDLSWITQADIVVAQVSTPSLGVGYEIAKALECNKKVICLYNINATHALSSMIAGNPSAVHVRYAEQCVDIHQLQTQLEEVL